MAYQIKDRQGNPVRFKGRTNILGMDCLESQVREFRPSDRTLLMVASQETPDRMGDIVIQSGISKENWRKNPVILFGHKYDSLPIGRGVEDFIEKKNGIKGTMIGISQPDSLSQQKHPKP